MIKYLFNSPQKKIVAGVVLFCVASAQVDLDVLLFQPAKFDQLNISEGKIVIGPSSVRGGTLFALIIDKQRIPFTCAMGSSYSEHCLQGNDAIKKYQSKTGRVWWAYDESSWFGHKSKRLYQLEVNGEMAISYQEQTKYYTMRRFPSWIVLLVLAVYWFIKLQFKR
ncbi:hypothetical protein [Methylomonas albis]|uniref:Uncharacterized protein n=1 Tax=Methylomonas albis TaxID=1854563 RepID=A0ABR9D2M9_9GAMM|nr:hypothetical protein [Methylomonas albis]MBD9357372.1 hypothetical protein [Methylomonas albis]